MRRATTGRMVRGFAGACSIIVVTASSASSFAQEPGQPPPPYEVSPSGAPAAPPPAAAPLPAPQPPPPPPPVMQRAAEPEPVAVDRAASDFNPELRRWAIGYAGISEVPIGAPNATTITVPAIGIRYWASPTVGVDFAFGVGWAGGSTEAAGMSTDKNSVSGFIFQAGVPIALATHRHVSFQLIPMLAVAHGSTTVGSDTTAMDFSGTRIDVGARAGFELFFGFIGIPELALSATVGIQFESREVKVSSNGFSQSDTTLGFATTVQNNPWDIFAGNIAARYYF